MGRTAPDTGQRRIRVQVRAAAASPMDWKIRQAAVVEILNALHESPLGHSSHGHPADAFLRRRQR